MKVPGTFTSTLVTVAELDALGHVFTSSTRPAGVEVYEGRRIFELDTGMWQSYDGSAWSPVGPVSGALTDWSSTLAVDQGGSNNISRSSTLATYSRVGRQITGMFRAVMNATGTATNPILATLPVAASATSDITAIGHAVFVDSVANLQPLIAVIGVTANRMQFITSETVGTTYYGNGETIGVGEILTCAFAYEAAS